MIRLTSWFQSFLWENGGCDRNICFCFQSIPTIGIYNYISGAYFPNSFSVLLKPYILNVNCLVSETTAEVDLFYRMKVSSVLKNYDGYISRLLFLFLFWICVGVWTYSYQCWICAFSIGFPFFLHITIVRSLTLLITAFIHCYHIVLPIFCG